MNYYNNKNRFLEFIEYSMYYTDYPNIGCQPFDRSWIISDRKYVSYYF